MASAGVADTLLDVLALGFHARVSLSSLPFSSRKAPRSCIAWMMSACVRALIAGTPSGGAHHGRASPLRTQAGILGR